MDARRPSCGPPVGWPHRPVRRGPQRGAWIRAWAHFVPPARSHSATAWGQTAWPARIGCAACPSRGRGCTRCAWARPIARPQSREGGGGKGPAWRCSWRLRGLAFSRAPPAPCAHTRAPAETPSKDSVLLLICYTTWDYSHPAHSCQRQLCGRKGPAKGLANAFGGRSRSRASAAEGAGGLPHGVVQPPARGGVSILAGDERSQRLPEGS